MVRKFNSGGYRVGSIKPRPLPFQPRPFAARFHVGSIDLFTIENDAEVSHSKTSVRREVPCSTKSIPSTRTSQKGVFIEP